MEKIYTLYLRGKKHGSKEDFVPLTTDVLSNGRNALSRTLKQVRWSAYLHFPTEKMQVFPAYIDLSYCPSDLFLEEWNDRT